MKKKLLFTGGGTSGHVAPVLAVMQAVEEEAVRRGCDIELMYAGTERDLESELIKHTPLKFKKYPITAGKLHRFLTVDQFRQAGRLVKGLVDGRRLIHRLRPDLVFAKGGYVTVPIVLAATRRNIPVFCHETDVLPGLANRMVAKGASLIFTAYPAAAYPTLPARKIAAVGQPVRPEYYQPAQSTPPEIAGRRLTAELPVLTVIGGSQGALRINQLIAECWEKLLPEMQVVLLAGPKHAEQYEKEADKLPAELRRNLWIVPFLRDTAELFKHSTVVLSRAGGTIAELAATHRPTILIPLPSAAQDHQRANARLLASAGAAIVLEEEGLTAAALCKAVLNLVKDEEKRKQLSKAISHFDHPDAAQAMARRMLDVIC